MSKESELRAFRENRITEHEEDERDFQALIASSPPPVSSVALKPPLRTETVREAVIAGPPALVCDKCGQALPEPWKRLGLSRRTYFRRKGASR